MNASPVVAKRGTTILVLLNGKQVPCEVMRTRITEAEDSHTTVEYFIRNPQVWPIGMWIDSTAVSMGA